jgi:hypothetical protein
VQHPATRTRRSRSITFQNYFRHVRQAGSGSAPGPADTEAPRVPGNLRPRSDGDSAYQYHWS